MNKKALSNCKFLKGKTAFCFTGQGSQYVGMGKGILAAFPKADEVFSLCEEIVGCNLKDIVLNGHIEELTKTHILQPALTALEISLFLFARDEKGISPNACAGHSLGEYPALFSCGVLSMKDCLFLIYKRGQYMEEAAQKTAGKMAAVIGMKREAIENALSAIMKKGVISIANYNSPEQIIITGQADLIDEATGLLRDSGAKRVIPLKVAGAYHSPLMKEASDKFNDILKKINFNPPICQYYSNVTGKEVNDPEEIRGIMAEQIVKPVLWYPIVSNMYNNGIRTFIEIGPKNVLINLIKRSIDDKEIATIHYGDYDDFN